LRPQQLLVHLTHLELPDSSVIEFPFESSAPTDSTLITSMDARFRDFAEQAHDGKTIQGDLMQ
jgi:hypothetical protein